jgi:hypothetical protein
MPRDYRPGDRGWVAYLGEYIAEVEFLGFEGGFEGEYPSSPTMYFRLLGSVYDPLANDKALFGYFKGDIIEMSDSENDKDKMFRTRNGALKAVIAYCEHWDARKKQEKNNFGEKVALYRSQLLDD